MHFQRTKLLQGLFLQDNARLDPVICSMRLLLMSKEVREAIKVNCKEEYEILCNFYGIVP